MHSCLKISFVGLWVPHSHYTYRKISVQYFQFINYIKTDITFVYGEYSVFDNGHWNVSPGIGAAFALSPDSEAYHFYGDTPGIVHVKIPGVLSVPVPTKNDC